MSRIQELFIKAGANENTIKVLKSSTYFDPEKFAELLILECVQAVMDGTKEGDHYAMRIENHFDRGEGGILRFVRCGEDE